MDINEGCEHFIDRALLLAGLLRKPRPEPLRKRYIARVERIEGILR